MIEETHVVIDGTPVRAITVELPSTRLVILAARTGYLMCGALDVELLDTRLAQRRIVAGRALGVRSYDDLLEQPLDRVTQAAADLGIRPGMTGREALRRLLAAEHKPAAAAPDGED